MCWFTNATMTYLTYVCTINNKVKGHNYFVSFSGTVTVFFFFFFFFFYETFMLNAKDTHIATANVTAYPK